MYVNIAGYKISSPSYRREKDAGGKPSLAGGKPSLANNHLEKL